MSTGASTPYGQSGSPGAQSTFPGGFAGGINLQGLNILNTYGGRVFWVDSNNGSDTNKGTFARPCATITGALAYVSQGVPGLPATNNDMIICKDGHAETVTAAQGINLNVAGVTVLGLGNGRRKPTITFTTSAAATIGVSATNVRMSGFRFVCNIASQVTMFDVGFSTNVATDFTLDGNEFSEGSATGLTFVDLVNTGAVNQADRLRLYNNQFLNPSAGNMTAAVKLSVVQDRVEVVGNIFRGNFSLSALHNLTATVMTNLLITNNYIRNLTAAKQAMNLISACTGSAFGNTFLAGDTTVAGAVPGSVTLGGGNIDNFGLMDVGERGEITKTFTSSNITTSPASILTATNGACEIDQIIVKSDGTGLAGGTNYQILSNNAKGLLNILVETVANLGASKTVDLFTASVTKQRTVIENTKAVQHDSTVGACTGAGTIDVTVCFRRVAAGACLVG